MELSKILSNLRMPKRWECFGLSGATIYAQSFSEFASNLRESDLVVVNGVEATLKLCALFTLAPILRRPFVAVDVVLRRPASPRSLLSALVIRHLLQRVDYFLH